MINDQVSAQHNILQSVVQVIVGVVIVVRVEAVAVAVEAGTAKLLRCGADK